jgi:hypothetical protein
MSCRETAGNSAVTSLSKFLTDADETLVASLFHKLRREAVDTLEDPNEPADAEAVRAFLLECGHLARHDARVREARRQSVLDRLATAEADLAAGNGPNKATFQAWSRLRDTIEQETSSIPAGAVITTDGLLVTRDEVDSARRAYEEALRTTADARTLLASTQRISTDPNKALPDSNDPVTLAERYRRLELAYDSSDTGYDELKSSASATPTHPGHEEWQQRVTAADHARNTPSPIRSARIAAERVGLHQARTNFITSLRHARTAIETARQNRAAGPNPDLDQTVRETQAAHKVFAYALLSTPELSGVMNADLRSPKAWSDISAALPGITRNEIWEAVETCMKDRDLAEARIGRITSNRISIRNRAREEARKAALTVGAH